MKANLETFPKPCTCAWADPLRCSRWKKDFEAELRDLLASGRTYVKIIDVLGKETPK